MITTSGTQHEQWCIVSFSCGSNRPSDEFQSSKILFAFLYHPEVIPLKKIISKMEKLFIKNRK
jgi:hypothetical protein